MPLEEKVNTQVTHAYNFVPYLRSIIQYSANLPGKATCCCNCRLSSFVYFNALRDVPLRSKSPARLLPIWTYSTTNSNPQSNSRLTSTVNKKHLNLKKQTVSINVAISWRNTDSRWGRPIPLLVSNFYAFSTWTKNLRAVTPIWYYEKGHETFRF